MQPVTRWRPQPTMGLGEEAAAPQRSTLLPVNIPATEWQLIVTARPSLLLVGDQSATDAALHALEPYFRQPLWRCQAETGLTLPEHPVGTMVLREVTALDPEQQTRLFDWLSPAGERVQIVSTTARPIASLVELGTFFADLYYRLNVVRLDLASPDESFL